MHKATIQPYGHGRKRLRYFYDGRQTASFVFPAVTPQFTSPLVGFENLLFRGGWGDVPVNDSNEDMFRSVFDGRRAVGQSWSVDREKALRWKRETERMNRDSNLRFGCHIASGEKWSYFVTIFRDATLGELFGTEGLRALDADYERAGIQAIADDNVSFFKISSYEHTLVGDLVQTDLEYERMTVIGLLYGYPIESTMALSTPL
jgi:hypothetical protein